MWQSVKENHFQKQDHVELKLLRNKHKQVCADVDVVSMFVYLSAMFKMFWNKTI